MKIVLLIILHLLAIYALISIILRILHSFFSRDLPKMYINEHEKEATILNACPFCGENHAMISETPEGFCVVCDSEFGGCGSSTGYFKTAIDAIDAWNTVNGECKTEWVSLEE